MTSRAGFLAAAFVLAGIVGAMAFMRTRMLPRFPYMATSLADEDFARMASQPGWQPDHFEVSPGITLRGLLRKPSSPTSPWVIFFNGNSAHLLGDGQKVLEALCAKRGWGAAIWAYRGFDSSGGSPSPADIEKDAYKAYTRLLREQGISPGSVHVLGFSLGTDIAAAVAAQAAGHPPASVTLLAPMTRLYMGGRLQLSLHRYDTSKWLAAIASPVLVVHGVDDATLPVQNGRDVAAGLGSRARLLEIPGMDHYELPFSGTVLDAVAGFIDQHAASEPPGASAP